MFLVIIKAILAPEHGVRAESYFRLHKLNFYELSKNLIGFAMALWETPKTETFF